VDKHVHVLPLGGIGATTIIGLEKVRFPCDHIRSNLGTAELSVIHLNIWSFSGTKTSSEV
jgi:hypothetical protein